jgi:hypothetical protein
MVVPSWHAAIAKLQELPTRPPIDQIRVLPSVVVVQNQEGVSQIVAIVALGLRPKQGLTRVWAKREAQESHLKLLKM